MSIIGWLWALLQEILRSRMRDTFRIPHRERGTSEPHRTCQGSISFSLVKDVYKAMLTQKEGKLPKHYHTPRRMRPRTLGTGPNDYQECNEEEWWSWAQPMWVCSVAQSCPTLCDPTDCSRPGSSVHGVFQARMLKWVAISSCRGYSSPRDWKCVSCVSCTDRWILYNFETGNPGSAY